MSYAIMKTLRSWWLVNQYWIGDGLRLLFNAGLWVAAIGALFWAVSAIKHWEDNKEIEAVRYSLIAFEQGKWPEYDERVKLYMSDEKIVNWEYEVLEELEESLIFKRDKAKVLDNL